MHRHSDSASFSEAEVTLVDHTAGQQWDQVELDAFGAFGGLDDSLESESRPTEPNLTRSASCARSSQHQFPRRASTVVDDTVDRAFRAALDEPEPLPATPVRHASEPRARELVARDAAESGSSFTAESLRQRRTWKRGATEARKSLAERKDQREALARVLAMARPRPAASRPAFPRMRARTENR